MAYSIRERAPPPRKHFRSSAARERGPDPVRPRVLGLAPGVDPAQFFLELEDYADKNIRSARSYAGQMPRTAVMRAAGRPCLVVWSSRGIISGLKAAFPGIVTGGFEVTPAMLRGGAIEQQAVHFSSPAPAAQAAAPN
jgi:hypothetical protein